MTVAEIAKLSSVEELDRHIAASAERDVWIFKHSLTCGISSAAWRPFQQFAGDAPSDDGPRFAVIEIQNARDLSRAVAERLEVRHESPQALLIRDGRVVWHASHWDIDRRALEAAS